MYAEPQLLAWSGKKRKGIREGYLLSAQCNWVVTCNRVIGVSGAESYLGWEGVCRWCILFLLLCLY